MGLYGPCNSHLNTISPPWLFTPLFSALAEPALSVPLAGAVHWVDPWGVNHPGALVQPYAVLLMARGGRLLTGDASSLIRR